MYYGKNFGTIEKNYETMKKQWDYEKNPMKLHRKLWNFDLLQKKNYGTIYIYSKL